MELGVTLEKTAERLPDPARVLYRGATLAAWVGSPGRIAEERRGIEALGSHAARPNLVYSNDRCLVFEGIGTAVEQPVEQLIPLLPRSVAPQAGKIGELLSHLVPVNPARALARLGLSRSRSDRLRAQVTQVITGVGPGLGGVHPGWLHESKGTSPGAVSLSFQRAGQSVWGALDLARAELALRINLRGVHAQLYGTAEPQEQAYALARLAIGLHELSFGPNPDADELAHSALDQLLPDANPTQVSVSIQGPDWLPRERWLPAGNIVSASQARWLLRELDGLQVGGSVVHVQVNPPVRKGHASPHFQPRGERRRELFSRWAEGIQCDEEGLYSATEEELAQALVRGARGVVVDGTAGIGSLTIALARSSSVDRVIAVDISAERLSLARHNAAIYGVSDRIDFQVGNIEELLAEEPGRFERSLGVPRVDALILDPPWGGPGYSRSRMGFADLGIYLPPLLTRFSGSVMLKLPKSFDVAELPPGFGVEALVDRWGILKFLVARR